MHFRLPSGALPSPPDVSVPLPQLECAAPTRAVAYLNLGDACAKLQNKTEAKQAYEKYLELAPNSREAAGVTAKLKSLGP